ncbi:MAG: glutamate racemase [Roseburia sp.]
MDKTQQPIGVFDSGVGGISVLRELVRLMPEENYLFFGDSRHAPYGTKTLEEVRELSYADADFLVQQGAKALVVACNTVTSAAVELLRRKYADMPVIGIEPALKPAVLSKVHPRVLVMATPMTLREEKFHQLMLRYESQAEIVRLPCPGLVEFVERGELEGENLEQFLQGLFAPYRDQQIDCAVLGCTHYPLVRATIQKVLGSEVAVFDGGAGTARETRRRLLECGLKNPSDRTGSIRIENSLGTAEIQELCWRLLGREKL